jgi:flagellin-specific chaperone FliS
MVAQGDYMATPMLVDVLNSEVETENGESVTCKEPAQPQGKQNSYSAAAKAYRNEQLQNLSPVQVIDKLYSFAILACKKNDKTLAIKVITELIIGLNFEYEEIAVGLYRLYRYCKDCICQDKMDEAIVVLEELRATWAEAFHLST